MTVRHLSRPDPLPGLDPPPVADLRGFGDTTVANFHPPTLLPDEPAPAAEYFVVTVDVNNIFEVADCLDDAGIYTEDDIEAYYHPAADHEGFRAMLPPISDKWKSQLADARMHQDQEEVDRFLEFRTDLRTYLKS